MLPEVQLHTDTNKQTKQGKQERQKKKEGGTEVAKAAGATDAVEVGLRVLREVKVDDHVDRLDVNAARKEVGADQVSALAVAEVVEHAVALVLRHLPKWTRPEERVRQKGGVVRQKWQMLEAGWVVRPSTNLNKASMPTAGVPGRECRSTSSRAR